MSTRDADTQTLVLNPDVVYFVRDGHFVCDDYVRHEQWSLESRWVPLLLWFTEPRPLSALSGVWHELPYVPEEAQAIIAQFVEVGLLVGTEQHQGPTTRPSNAWSTWGRAATYFHFNSRKRNEDVFLPTVSDNRRLVEKNTHEPRPPLYKTYDEAPRVALSAPQLDASSTFPDVLLRRQTIRSYDPDQAVAERDLSTLLYLVFGEIAVLLDQGMGSVLYRTSPTGGARSSLEAYVCVFNVDGLEPGLYHYNVRHHALEQLRCGLYREHVAFLCGGQPHAGLPAFGIFYTSVLERVCWKYDDPRVYRALYAEMGHFSQTLYLTAGALDLGAFFLAQFRDEGVEEFLGLDYTREIPLGYSGVGVLMPGARRYGRFYRKDVLPEAW